MTHSSRRTFFCILAIVTFSMGAALLIDLMSMTLYIDPSTGQRVGCYTNFELLLGATNSTSVTRPIEILLSLFFHGIALVLLRRSARYV